MYSSLCLFCSIRIVTDIRTQNLHNSLPISSFKQSKYCLPISTTVNFCIFPPLLIPADCYFLLDPPSIFWSWITFSPSSCSELPISVSSGSVTETWSLENFRSPTLQAVLLRIHDIIIWPFPFHRSPTTWYCFFSFSSFLHYFLICVTCPYIPESLRKKTCFRYLASRESFASLG